MKSATFVLLAAILANPLFGAPPTKNPAYTAQPWGDWVESDFPFFSSVVDARRAGVGENNLTPRGLVLNLGQQCWVCFDTDLLRVAAIWRGKGVTDKALAQGSYHDPGRKTPGGQFPAPQPDGKLWLGNAILAGWQEGGTVSLLDPREPAPTPREVGRGPLPLGLGGFKALRMEGAHVVLEYEALQTLIQERWRVSGSSGGEIIERHVRMGPSQKTLLLILGAKQNGPSQEIEAGVTVTAFGNAKPSVELLAHDTLWVVKVAPHSENCSFAVTFCDEHAAPACDPFPKSPSIATKHWPQQAFSKIAPAANTQAYVVDDIGLPVDNPWRRAIRLSDIQFLKDGTGVVVTIDGDVWKVGGLNAKEGAIRWSRFASGLHEPMTLAIREEEIFVFDRNGIWKLLDTNGDGEADVHELFSNNFAQTADMREFPCTLRLAPNGEFVIAKGGQEATTLGKHNGSILRISADGKTSEVLGYGFRQPNLGVNLKTGLVTASDQEGQYVPTTPLHIVKDHQFYGFLSEKRPKEAYPAPIADPLLWIPHSVNASGVSQVWLFGAKMGSLNDSLVHIGFNKPEIFSVQWNQRGTKPQASVVGITTSFHFPPLNGSVNPTDGQLYLAGFQVLGWGNSLNTLAGFGRVRYTGKASGLPREVVAMENGILLRFEEALDDQRSIRPESYSIARWGYKRSHTYGSALYKDDGSKGIEMLPASSAYLSKDHCSVFIGVPRMATSMQLRVGWTLLSASGVPIEQNAYTTPYELAKFDPVSEGFDAISIDLTPRAAPKTESVPVTVEEGRRLSQVLGCVACHSTSDRDYFHVGPKWLGLFGSERSYIDADQKRGMTIANEAYLRESILDPHAKTVAGYEKGEYAMPSYAGMLTEPQLEALILFIKSLKVAR